MTGDDLEGAHPSERGPATTKSTHAAGVERKGALIGSSDDQIGERRVRTLSGFTVVVAKGAPERNALEIAGRQRGRINRRQLSAAYWTAGRIRAAGHRGWLRRAGWGVYIAGADTRPPLARETEALLGAGLDVALAGVSVLMALSLIPRRGDEPIHITSITGRRRNRREGIICHSIGDLTATDFRVFDGLAMTTVERALLDAAGSLDTRQVERALDEAVARRLTSRTKLRDLVARVRLNHPAHALLTALADQRRPSSQTESELAERALGLIRTANLPPPSTEANLFGFRADKYWPEAGVVLEVDSFQFHGLIRANFDRDRRKDRIYAQNDIHVVRWSDSDMQERPMELTAQLGMTIARRIEERSARRRRRSDQSTW